MPSALGDDAGPNSNAYGRVVGALAQDPFLEATARLDITASSVRTSGELLVAIPLQARFSAMQHPVPRFIYDVQLRYAKLGRNRCPLPVPSFPAREIRTGERVEPVDIPCTHVTHEPRSYRSHFSFSTALQQWQ